MQLGLAATREEAQRLVLAGLVLEGTRPVAKAGEMLAAGAALALRGRSRFVSRGGEKLEAALDAFGLDVRGAACLDAGCSTGGFTDCLLQRGAAHVLAVDVGYGQFAWSLRQDPRVDLRERTNVRSLDPESLDPRPTVLVADLSFVSLRSILPSLVRLVAPPPAPSVLVLLVKPQFEVRPAETERGVVVDPEARARALQAVEAALHDAGLEAGGVVESPIRGAEGNVEYLLVARFLRAAGKPGA